MNEKDKPKDIIWTKRPPSISKVMPPRIQRRLTSSIDNAYRGGRHEPCGMYVVYAGRGVGLDLSICALLLI